MMSMAFRVSRYVHHARTARVAASDVPVFAPVVRLDARRVLHCPTDITSLSVRMYRTWRPRNNLLLRRALRRSTCVEVFEAAVRGRLRPPVLAQTVRQK